MNEAESETARWLLLIHQLPAKPAYVRVKIWRRLQVLGAVTVKNSVYALPSSEQAQEDFEWVLKEIIEAGGEAMICEARLVDGLSDDEVRLMFTRARDEDYAAVATDARALTETLGIDPGPTARADAKPKVARLASTVRQIVAIDFFGSNGRETVDGLLRKLTAMVNETDEAPSGSEAARSLATLRGGPTGRTWVTRRGVYVDRIASAWLIRRFIDPQARFKFVPGKGYVPEPGELRFDMFEAEFTHEGDRCTFEVLLERSALKDRALTAIAEIVHDIDLKDSKFSREETSGIANLITGLSMGEKTDEQRIERGAAVFDDLYEYFRKRRR
jgi:hypothetical protein